METETSRREKLSMYNEGERLDDLQNGLYLIQNPAYFCFGIDAVLLSHFPVVRNRDRILDMGCGSGVIPLILSTCSKTAAITGLEIQEVMADLAKRNVEYNRLSDRIRIVQGDIREADHLFGAASFTLITCNPPYMPLGCGKENENESVVIARHEVLVHLDEIIRAASHLLVQGGRFCMINRPARIPEMFSLMREVSLEPKRMRLIHPTAEKAANLVMIEAVRGGKPYLTVEPPLIVHEKDGSYTPAIREIYYGAKGKALSKEDFREEV